MKHLTTAVFESRDAAEKAINQIHNRLSIPNDDISFIYRNTEGEVHEVDAGSISTSTPVEGAREGAAVGGTIGAIAGLAVVAGLIPVIGPIFSAGVLTTALGLTGAIGTTAAGALTGAVAGGLVGALVNLGVGKEHAKRYEDLVMGGNILVAVYAREGVGVSDILKECGALDVNTYAPTV